jgi:quinol monooxygenase YgiN
MHLRRRDFMAITGTAALGAALPGIAWTQETKMYGLIGKMIAAPGKRDELIAIMLEGVSAMPGCLSYVVARDPANTDWLWITEVWDNEASHKGSLSLPAVQQAIARAKPIIAGFGDYTVTEPVGGHGLAK